MNKLEVLENILNQTLDSSKNPILAFSGGKDSALILQLLQKMDRKIPLLCFKDFWNEYQLEFIKKMFMKHSLQIFFYSPFEINFQEPYLQALYHVGGVNIPVIMDYIYDSKYCGLEIGRKAKAESHIQPAYPWDLTLLGTKKLDKHALVKDYSFDNYNTENHTFATPLWDWSDDEVFKAIRYLDFEIDERVYTEELPKADTGAFVACMDCLSGKSRFYCPKESKVYLPS